MGAMVPRRSLAGLAFVGLGLVGLAAATLTGSAVVGQPTPPSLRVLQLNLCNSGMAGCYTGRAVAAAATVIRAGAPDVVALNEICADDLVPLTAAMHEARGAVAASFQPAWDRDTDEGIRCRNGQQYGIGLLVRLASPATAATRTAGLYPAQETVDPEERAWLCLTTPDLAACTTHLAAASTAIASAQCDYLVGTVLPGIRAGHRPAVLSGDFNLGPDALASCLPPGLATRDDAGVQYVAASTDLPFSGVRLIDMSRATDHPGLLATLRVGPVPRTFPGVQQPGGPVCQRCLAAP